jgi:hypothetical protein
VCKNHVAHGHWPLVRCSIPEENSSRSVVLYGHRQLPLNLSKLCQESANWPMNHAAKNKGVFKLSCFVCNLQAIVSPATTRNNSNRWTHQPTHSTPDNTRQDPTTPDKEIRLAPVAGTRHDVLFSLEGYGKRLCMFLTWTPCYARTPSLCHMSRDDSGW